MAERFGSEGTGNNSLEADEALGPRGIIRYATLEEFKANPDFAQRGRRARQDRDGNLAVPQLEL